MDGILKTIVDRIIKDEAERFRNFEAAAFPLVSREAPIDILERCQGAFLMIAEVKKGSPSRGVIREDYDPARIARSYQEGGASAVSVITEKNYFFGDPDDLGRVKNAIRLPVLRNDFIVHECQIYESYNWGADLVLLIAACLGPGELNRLHRVAVSLGMRVLVEIRDELELEWAMEAHPRIIGINNRDLITFEVDWTRSLRLRPLVPPGICLISESGIHSHAQIQALQKAGFSGVLVGEHLMKQDDPIRALRNLIHGQS
jgi:indole-3-glycerol phosphate synthase